MTPRRSALTALTAITLATVGCAATSNAPAPKEPYDVTVIFTANAQGTLCPTGVEVLQSKRCKTEDAAACLGAKRGEVVTFGSRPAGRSFSLHFDPFRKHAIDGSKGWAQERIDPEAPLKAQGYSYNLLAPNCPIIDPRIIITQ